MYYDFIEHQNIELEFFNALFHSSLGSVFVSIKLGF